MEIRHIAVIVALAAVGCGGSDTAARKSDGASSSAVRKAQVVERVDLEATNETRTVTPASAKSNFSSAFPSLAGAKGKESGSEPSQALTDMFSVWDTLDANDRAQVREALQPDSALVGTVIGKDIAPIDANLGGAAGQMVPMRTQAEQALFELRDISVELERRTGVTLTKGYSVVVDPTDLPRSETTAWAVAVAMLPVLDVPPRWVGMDTTDCVVFVGQRAFNSSETQRRSVLAHELFHCFQYQAMGGRTVAEWTAIPAWVTEGTAAWVGEKYVNGSGTSLARSWWDIYLGGQNAGGARHGFALFGGNGYPGIGYFEYLNANGVDMWHRALNVFVGNSTSSAAFAFFNRGVDATVLARWGAGPLQQAGWPAAWRAPVIGSPAGQRTPKAITIRRGGSANDAIGLGSHALYRYTLDPSVEVLELTVAGQAHLGFNGGDEQTLTSGTTLRWCLQGTECLCPSGAPPNLSPALLPATPGTPLTLALAGITGPASAVAVGYSTADLCDRCPPAAGGGGGGPGRHLALRPDVAEPTCGPPAPADPTCIVGTWTMDANQLLANLPPEAKQGGEITGFSGAILLTFGADGKTGVTFDNVRMTTNAPIAGADGVEEIREQSVVLTGSTTSTYSYDGSTLNMTAGSRNISGKVTMDIPGAGKFEIDFPAPLLESIISGFGVAGGGTLSQAAQCSAATLTISTSQGGTLTLSKA